MAISRKPCGAELELRPDELLLLVAAELKLLDIGIALLETIDTLEFITEPTATRDLAELFDEPIDKLEPVAVELENRLEVVGESDEEPLPPHAQSETTHRAHHSLIKQQRQFIMSIPQNFTQPIRQKIRISSSSQYFI